MAPARQQTIIECLKYATTGDLPPNSKGGAFIHDPKLCGEKEVLAQVKLSFKGTSGAKMVATRSLQLTVKKTTRTQKTLEGQLQMVKDGERTAISSRVAELDQIIPQYLGVSKAVLDSVIFCHQDESLWPMSEPAGLKKKFDEIFEALKYTKAIANIKDLGKAQKNELKRYKDNEQNARDNKDKADRAEKKSKELSKEIEQLKTETLDLNKKVREAAVKADEAWDKASNYRKVVDSLKFNKDKHDWLQESLEKSSRDLQKRTESDKWLQTELDQYEQRMIVHEEHKQKETKRYENLRRAIELVREKLRTKHVEAGKYEEQKANHDQQIEQQKSMIRDTARHHNIRGYETELDEMQISEYMESISKLYKDQTSNIERVRRETEREMKELQDILTHLGERKSALQEGKNSARQQSTSNERKIVLCQSEFNRIDIDEGAKTLLEANIEDLTSRLQKSKDNYRNGAWDTKAQESNYSLRSLEDDGEKLNRELIHGTKQAGDLARLDYLKKELVDRQRGLDTMTGAHGGRFGKMLGHNWQPASLEIDFQKVIDRVAGELKEAERRRDSVSRDLEQIEFQMRSTRRDLKKGEQELQKCAQHIRESMQGEPEEYTETMEGLQRDRDIVKADVENMSTMRKWYSDCLETANENQKCRLCVRPFRGDQERVQFVARIEKLMSRGAADVLEELKDIEVDLQRAKDAGHSHETWSRLSTTELPRLNSEVKKLEGNRETLLREIEGHDKRVNDREETTRDVQTLSKPIANILKYSHDIASFKEQTEELAGKQDDAGLSRTLEDIQEQLEAVRAKSRDLRGNVTKLAVEKERARSQTSTLELDLSKATNNLTTANYQLEKKANISREIDDLQKVNQEHRDTTGRLDKQIQELAPRIAEEETKLDDIKQRGSIKEKELQQGASRLADTTNKFRLAEQNIQAYIDGGGSAKLAKCHREIEGAQQEIGETEAEQKQLVLEINKISDELRNHQETKRIIAANITYRQSQQELGTVKTEIAKLSAQNAEADLAHHTTQSEYWHQQHKLASTAETSKMSTMKAKDDVLMGLLKDWDTDHREAAHKYKESHIKVETTKAAIEDLARYGGALDKAIMRFHGLKMEEINGIIEELWRKTYQGTDVDTILIRSETETAKGNQSYNYRVCMIKQDVEMDMRGRCSAGQKVLACIIIRLALAECFGVHCGLIALDEPTTNLDSDNIRSLAESLHDIIKMRQQQSNFQLIVITHDEEFLKYMKGSEFCDTYWRISRSDRQKSHIQRQSIVDII